MWQTPDQMSGHIEDAPIMYSTTGASACTIADFSDPLIYFTTAEISCNAVYADPGNYHCLKADLKSGTSPNYINIDDTINIKVGDTLT